MAALFIFNKQQYLLLTTLMLLIYGFSLGKAQIGIAGSGTGYIPQPGSGAGGGFGNGGGGFGVEDLSKALICLSDKVYSECEESYRLTESGDLHVPPDYIEQYCSGPCLKETDLVLKCINNVFSNFLFKNRASILNVKDAIKAGCSYGPSRGNFNVAEHIQADESGSCKSPYSILFWLSSLISVLILLF
ncbi:hypothetical protein QVD17_01663 [Tagetes erecta]|uniref:DUF7731 domain-containing protein n=1 Tax=Tagetes erecta TaxID=13708 RepID=A0AAD8LB04_TARER|nr:hypothetical protein QVD17_01663 [Tagetes erecta]